MTHEEAIGMRRRISFLFSDYGRVKGLLEHKGLKIDTPHGVFLTGKSELSNSFLFEIDGLNQIWSSAETLRDKVEELIDVRANIDFGEADREVSKGIELVMEALDNVEKSIQVKISKLY